MSALRVVVVSCLLVSVCRADMPPDEEVARREFAAASVAYEAARYEEALQHLAAVKQAHDVPEVDYNIGRCYDRMGKWSEAAAAYERYLAARPAADNVAEIRERIATLRSRRLEVQIAPVTPPPAKRPRRWRLAAGLLLGGSLALGVVGSAVYGSAYHDFSVRRDACQGRCDPTSLGGLDDEITTRSAVAGVMWTLAGLALAADVALWVLDARAARRVHAWVGPGGVRF